MVTSAELRGGRLFVPEKITSSMAAARMLLCEVSPITHRNASSRFDFPQPLGPTTPVSPDAMTSSVGSTKDLKPSSLRREIFIAFPKAQAARSRLGVKSAAQRGAAPEARACTIGSTSPRISSIVSTFFTSVPSTKKLGVPMTPSLRPRSLTHFNPSIMA